MSVATTPPPQAAAALPAMPRWRFWPVWRRNALVWRKLALPSLLGNIAEPLLTLAAFGWGVGSLVGSVDGVPYILFLASGTVSMSVMNSASFEALYSAFSRMHVQKTWDAILLTPTTLDDVLLGELLWAATKALMSGVALVVVVALLGISRQPTLLLVLPLLALVGMMFSALGLIVNALAKSYDFFTYYFTLVLTPMTFLSGIFFPLSAMPLWLQRVAEVLPLQAAVQLVRPLFFGHFDTRAGLHLAILLAYLLGGWLLARWLTQRRFAA
ncbi:MAG: ABC transporter permease [Thiomonas sp.]|uniref:Nodulation protein J n=1 Tax=mine drainage metagenome TaxID=410659 RepID=E6PWL4_9ZZZZ|nr:ABC transporter permease [Thiomonas sp. X19]